MKYSSSHIFRLSHCHGFVYHFVLHLPVACHVHHRCLFFSLAAGDLIWKENETCENEFLIYFSNILWKQTIRYLILHSLSGESVAWSCYPPWRSFEQSSHVHIFSYVFWHISKGMISYYFIKDWFWVISLISVRVSHQNLHSRNISLSNLKTILDSTKMAKIFMVNLLEILIELSVVFSHLSWKFISFQPRFMILSKLSRGLWYSA
jgi:hypothetical protein